MSSATDDFNDQTEAAQAAPLPPVAQIKDAIEKSSNLQENEVRVILHGTDVPADANIRVMVHLYEVNEPWMTKFYKKYLNILYTTRARDTTRKETVKNVIYTCLVCKHEIKTWCSMKSHLGTHLKLQHRKCPHCGKCFNWRSSIRKHMSTVCRQK